MCDDDNPDAVPIPDDWEPEQAEAVILFLEAILERLQARYEPAIQEFWNDRHTATYAGDNPARDPDGDMPF